ncbi:PLASMODESMATA CALLOSE-BINDING PROTEIN 3 [Linum perenne]
MAPSSSLQSAVFLLLFNLFILLRHPSLVEATWCVARSDASTLALQTALDYACWAGADCTPIQSNGLCFLPNTIQAHASYAFNSYFQRKSMSPGSCDFSGTANIARTDPSAMDRAFIRVLSGSYIVTRVSVLGVFKSSLFVFPIPICKVKSKVPNLGNKLF